MMSGYCLLTFQSSGDRMRLPAERSRHTSMLPRLPSAQCGDSPGRDTEPAVRNWFVSDYVASHPWAILLSGIPSVNGRQPHAEPRKPIENAILSYRDHKTVCGLSKAGIQATTALRNAGFEVFDLDYALPRDRMREEYTHNTSLVINSRRNLHLLNMNPEYVPECLLLNAARVRSRDYIVGQFYWELSNTSIIHETGLALIDEIWVASSYLADVFSQHTNKPIINMGQAVTEPPPSNLGRAHFGLPDKDYLFLLNFDAMSSIERKNPLSAVRAFRQAFPLGKRARRTDYQDPACRPGGWQRPCALEIGSERSGARQAHSYREPDVIRVRTYRSSRRLRLLCNAASFRRFRIWCGGSSDPGQAGDYNELFRGL